MRCISAVIALLLLSDTTAALAQDRVLDKSLLPPQARISIWDYLQNYILATSQDACQTFKLVDISVTREPAKGAKSHQGTPIEAPWSETWKVDQCGPVWHYRINLAVDQKGDLGLEIQPSGGGPSLVDCVLPSGSKIRTTEQKCKESSGNQNRNIADVKPNGTQKATQFATG